MSATSYDPKYADVEDVPVTGPDPFTEADKRRALAAAEAQLESDVNDGEGIESPEYIHRHASASFGSYVLATGPKSPDSATLGDMADEGSGRMDFAHELLAMYDRAVESILGASDDEGGVDEGEGGEGYSGTRTPAYVVSRR